MQTVTVPIRLSEPFADSPDKLRLAMNAVEIAINKRLTYRERRWFYFRKRLVSLGEVIGVWHDPKVPDQVTVTITPYPYWRSEKKLTAERAKKDILARIKGVPAMYFILPAE